MFTEPFLQEKKRGWIEVISGSMFSGKTEELIRRLKRALIANQQIKIFKPVIDTRYHPTKIVSHDDNAFQSLTVHHPSEILLHTETANVIAIDEAQFFDNPIIDVCNELADKGCRVIVAGLDMDYAGDPFGPMPGLLATAEYITKLHAICVVCGNIANYSYRKKPDQSQVLLGEKEVYEPRCRICYQH